MGEPTPRELLVKWRTPTSPGYYMDADADTAARSDCADDLEASIAAHPVVEVGDLLYDEADGYKACRIQDCPYLQEGTSTFPLRKHAAFCPVSRSGAALAMEAI